MKKSMKVLIVVLLIIIIGSASFFGYMFMNGLSGIRINPKYKDGQVKVALVGDSVTYGHSIKNWPKNNYPALLADMLGERYCVKSYGVSGSTVQPDGDQPYNITKAYTWSHDFECDILVLMLGSNDSKPENWKGAEIFKAEYLKLLKSYLQVANSPDVYVCTPPKAYFPEGKEQGPTNYNIQPVIVEEIADIIRDVATENDYTIIDINSLTDNRRDLFGNDNVHPNNEGAAEIAEAVYKFINEDKR